jgi:hypothetical protein
MDISTPGTLLTIFTAPKPFIHPHISLIQRNAIQSWQRLGGQVEVLMIGDEPGMAEFAADEGIQHLPEVTCNAFGTPLVSSIFELARRASASPLLAYVNADIILTPQFLETARLVYSQAEKFLIVGQRYDIDLQQPLDFSAGWDFYLLSDVQTRGHLHPPAGSDYFIFPRSCFTEIPNFAIGRAGWDNWMIYHARTQHYVVIDATSSIVVVHQDHDYSHLPNGQPHYRLPESSENIRLAGGPRTIFTLADAECFVHNGRLHRIPLQPRKLMREIEIYPLIRWNSTRMADIFFAIFHPDKIWKKWWDRLVYKIKPGRDSNA